MKDVESAQAKRVKKRKTLENWLLGIGIFCIATVVLIVVGIVCFWLYRRSRKKDNKKESLKIDASQIPEKESLKEEESYEDEIKKQFSDSPKLKKEEYFEGGEESYEDELKKKFSDSPKLKKEKYFEEEESYEDEWKKKFSDSPKFKEE